MRVLSRGAALALSLALLGCGGASAGGGGAARVELPPLSPEAVQAYSEGIRLLEAGGPRAEERAEQRFRRAVELDPNLWEAHYNLGVLERRRGEVRDAITALEAARAIAPGSGEVLTALAEARYTLGEQDQAAELLSRYVEGHPEAVQARVALAAILRERGEHEEALRRAREALIREPRNARALAEVGRIYRARERYEVAELVFRKALEIQQSATVENDLGLLELARGDTQAAFEHFARAIEQDPRFLPARLNQGSVLLHAGDYAGAAQHYEAVLGIDEGHLAARVALGVCLRGQGDHPRARREYERALTASPNHPEALFNLAVLLAEFLDERPEARELFVRFLRVGPNGPYREAAERYLHEIPAPAPAPAARRQP